MDKTKVSLIVIPIVMSLVCIVLAAYAVGASVQLNAERIKTLSFNSQLVALGAQLSDITTEYNEQAKIARDLQFSLDAARRDTDNVRRELDALRAAASAPERPATE